MRTINSREMAEIGRQNSITVATPTQNSGTTSPVTQNSGTTSPVTQNSVTSPVTQNSGTTSPVTQNSGTNPEVKETIKEKGIYEKFNDKVDWAWGPYDRSE